MVYNQIKSLLLNKKIMKLFYKYNDDLLIEVISSSDSAWSQIKTPIAEVQTLVDGGEAIIFDTIELLNNHEE